MNATKLVVLLIFTGVVCARQLEEVFKETKLGIPVPKTVTTNGFGAELDSVNVTTYAENIQNSTALAGVTDTGADASGNVYKYTIGTVTAEGPNASAYSESYAAGRTNSGAASGPDAARGNSSSSGVAYSNAGGSTTD